MRLLGCLDPDLQPRATQHIGAMIATIQRIIEHGHGYAVEGGDVFFDVPSMPDYGRLSGRQQVRYASFSCVAILDAARHEARLSRTLLRSPQGNTTA